MTDSNTFQTFLTLKHYKLLTLVGQKRVIQCHIEHKSQNVL